MISIRLILHLIFAVVATGLYSVPDAAADEKTCIFKADVRKVQVTVWDEDSGEDRQDKIYEGWLTPEQRHKVTSQTGYIVFSYQLADADRSYGDNHRRCQNGNIIRVP